MKERRQCVSLHLLGLQVIWMIVTMSITKFGTGEPKRLIANSAVLVIGYLPTVVALFFALIEMRYPKQKSLNRWSVLALGISILILSTNLMMWYHLLWLDPHGIWNQRK